MDHTIIIPSGFNKIIRLLNSIKISIYDIYVTSNLYNSLIQTRCQQSLQEPTPGVIPDSSTSSSDESWTCLPFSRADDIDMSIDSDSSNSTNLDSVETAPYEDPFRGHLLCVACVQC